MAWRRRGGGGGEKRGGGDRRREREKGEGERAKKIFKKILKKNPLLKTPL